MSNRWLVSLAPFVTGLAALGVPGFAAAAAPAYVPVTGYLTDDAGVPVDGSTALHLALYTSTSTSSALWEEDQTVDVDQGQFTVYLGEDTALALDTFRDNGSLYLGITVGTNAELTPRLQVASAPYAAYAQYCDDAETVGGIDPADFALLADVDYSNGTGLDLSSSGVFSVNQLQIETWAKAVTYDTQAELRTQLDTIYMAKQPCPANQVLSSDGLGGWICTDSANLPSVLSLTGRVSTAESNITTLQGQVFDVTANHTLSGANTFTGTTRIPSGNALPGVAGAGALFFNTGNGQIYASNGTAWVQLVQAPGPSTYPASCQALKTSAPTTPDGIQWIDPDGAGSVAPYQAYCDMTTDGGGWTLVWTKTSPTFVTWKATTDYSCARQITGDCASAVPGTLTWTKAMWRFADSQSVVVEWDKNASTELRDFLMGSNLTNSASIGGWSKWVGGAYTAPSTIGSFYYYAANGVSENHGNSDAWLDLWSAADGTNNYVFIETNASLGTKCIGGWCRYGETVLMFVR